METTDILILGGGIAGLSLALKVAGERDVVVVTKGSLWESNSSLAQGGIAVPITTEDSLESHIEDTLKTGCGLSRREVVETIIGASRKVMENLLRLGVTFSEKEGTLHLGQEGGHSHRRIVHVGDMTGKAIMETLIHHVKNHPRITVLENTMAVDLITTRRHLGSGENLAIGAYLLRNDDRKIEPFLARVTVLATGGSGKVYLYTSNPDIATGDGVAMAYRAGCRIANMEFFQFHPTCLFHPKAKNFLISEAVRGEGGILLNLKGERFMEKIHPLKELAPRDIVARAIDEEMKRTGAEYVLLDISHKDPAFIEERFPTLTSRLKEFGYDMTREPIPVVPAAHYQCGGVITNLFGETDIPNLFAIGEVAHTGFHGANRLASNSLLEALVMADRAGERILSYYPYEKVVTPSSDISWRYGSAVPPEEEIIVTHNWEEVRRTMWSYVGIVRTNKWLERARRRLSLLAEEILSYYWEVIPTKGLLELRNLVQVAWLIVLSAQRRKESRGLHYNLDYPHTLESTKDTIIDPIVHFP